MSKIKDPLNYKWSRGVYRQEIDCLIVYMCEDETLDGAIAYLQSIREKVPAEFRDQIKLIWESGESGDWLKCFYERPITEEEHAAHNNDQAMEIAAKTAKERAEYERLKAIYGDK